MLRLRHFRGLHPSACHIRITYCVLNPDDGRQSEIMVMGWKYLDANLRKVRVDESIREVIHDMAGGDAAHQADALKFGLYGALRARQECAANHPFARLRCPDASCKAHHNPVSYLDPGNSINCTRHNVGGWGRAFGSPVTPKIMECSECGHARTDRCTWCKGCRRMFG